MLTLLLVLPAVAGTTWNPMSRTRSLVVEVVDDLGRPVSTATIRVDDENLRHRVNHRTGKWRSDAVYPASVPDDFEARYRGVPIDPGHMLDLQTGALLCDTLVLKRNRNSYMAYPKGTKFHTVAKGEHLTAIAADYDVPVPALCYLNGLSQRARLRVGQRLLVLPKEVAEQFAEARP